MLRLTRDWSSLRLTLFLLLGVLAPSGSVLWFMNDAARSQAESARQRVAEAYRGQLRLQRERVDAWWMSRAAALDAASNAFLPALQAAGADAVILLDAQGSPLFPVRPSYPAEDPTPALRSWQEAETKEREQRTAEAAASWESLARSLPPRLAARAAQAQIRCLVRAGRHADALSAIERYFAAGPVSRTMDREGRLIGADEQLLALHLLPRGGPQFTNVAQRLAALLNTYDGPPMISGQRLFLMSELRALAPDAAQFPWYAAELLAEQFLETERLRPGTTALHSSSIGGAWQLTSPNHRVIALYRDATVRNLMKGVLVEPGSPAGVRFAVAPPGTQSTLESVPAGAMLPGWQISVELLDAGLLDQAAHRSTAAYIWLGSAVVVATLLAGIFAGHLFRRQAHLNRLKTDLLAAVSHELKTPLASMRLLLETLLEDGHADAEKTRDYLKLIAGENLRLTRLVENFLMFSRIERNRAHFDFAQTHPAAIVESALAAMHEHLHAPDCHLETQLSPNLPLLEADADALTTVLLNLLDNACKYTPAEKHIRLRAYQENGRLAFEVEDNGIGIAPREQKRIFRRFYQVDRRLARHTGGCGLGLSIVEFIVRSHGGEVVVESRPGVGSTFRVWLPCRTAAREAVA